MSFHDDFQGWSRFLKPDGCPVCQNWPPPEDMVTIAEFPTSWLDAHPRVCLRGTCCLVLKPHAVELYDMADADLLAFMKEAQLCARALKAVTGAVKINYEIHGNTVPHLHMHLFPRYRDDPFPGAPIDFRRVEPPVYKGGEFLAFVEAMRRALRPQGTASESASDEKEATLPPSDG